jgi:hypothetical protein
MNDRLVEYHRTVMHGRRIVPWFIIACILVAQPLEAQRSARVAFGFAVDRPVSMSRIHGDSLARSHLYIPRDLHAAEYEGRGARMLSYALIGGFVAGVVAVGYVRNKQYDACEPHNGYCDAAAAAAGFVGGAIVGALVADVVTYFRTKRKPSIATSRTIAPRGLPSAVRMPIARARCATA